jgi:glycosyltransferase involved in cell wall biosynthesis
LKDLKDENINNAVYIANGVYMPKKITKNKSHDKIEFIFVGRIEDQKCINYLIDAVKEVTKSHKNFEISLIGEGSKKKELEKQIEKLKLKKYFIFLGSKTNKEVMKYYSKSDIFILPSIWEGLPLTLLEAASFGLPIIITDVGGSSKIFKNNKNALIIRPKDSKAIADAIIKLIENKEFRIKLGKSGREIVKTDYTWEKIAKEVNDAYRGVLRK